MRRVHNILQSVPSGATLVQITSYALPVAMLPRQKHCACTACMTHACMRRAHCMIGGLIGFDDIHDLLLECACKHIYELQNNSLGVYKVLNLYNYKYFYFNSE